MRAIYIVIITIALVMCGVSANALTLTFDDLPSGEDLSYYNTNYGISFSDPFRVADSSEFDWGATHSGTKVLALSPDWRGTYTGVMFKKVTGYEYEILRMRAVRACFSTMPGVVVTMTGYTWDGNPVGSITIGSSEGSWDAKYVELSSDSSEISFINFFAVSSPDAMHKFYTDDMTLVPVPEPSSLAALGFGLVPMAAAKRLRRRKG